MSIEDDTAHCHEELSRLVKNCLTGNVENSRTAFDELADFVVENNQTIIDALANKRPDRSNA